MERLEALPYQAKEIIPKISQCSDVTEFDPFKSEEDAIKRKVLELDQNTIPFRSSDGTVILDYTSEYDDV